MSCSFLVSRHVSRSAFGVLTCFMYFHLCRTFFECATNRFSLPHVSFQFFMLGALISRFFHCDMSSSRHSATLLPSPELNHGCGCVITQCAVFWLFSTVKAKIHSRTRTRGSGATCLSLCVLQWIASLFIGGSREQLSEWFL